MRRLRCVRGCLPIGRYDHKNATKKAIYEMADSF